MIDSKILVQAFVTGLAVEALDEAVLHRPSGRDEVQRHLVLPGPPIDDLAGELGAVVDHDRLRFAALTPICLQQLVGDATAFEQTLRQTGNYFTHPGISKKGRVLTSARVRPEQVVCSKIGFPFRVPISEGFFYGLSTRRA